MTFGGVLYSLLIGPIEMLFGVIFAIVNRILNIPGLTIIVLSLVVNLLVMPLYKRADEMQEEQRKKDAELEHWTKHIKKTFKGDERYMMLQTYYRQNNYKPTDSLKGAVSLLLQIPFFMAAYNFLSNLHILQGCSFGLIADLGAPDAMLVIGGISINVLPIAMTLINVVSGYIYTKGFPTKAKVQLYGMALLFLVLLYDSPAGLVFYWTLNNVFSLVKNIIYKLKNPKLAVSALSAIAGAGVAVFALFGQSGASNYRKFMELVIAASMFLPLAFYVYGRKHSAKREKKEYKLERGEKGLFYAGAIFLALLIGFVIPLSIIVASPEEFMDRHYIESPLIYVLNATCLGFGLFVVWGSIFYSLAKDGVKRWMGLAVCLSAGMALVNYVAFSDGFGLINRFLVYEGDAMGILTFKRRIINLCAILAVFAVIGVCFWKKKRILRVALSVMSVAMLVSGIADCMDVNVAVKRSIASGDLKDAPAITMSTKGKNVIVIMMDRAQGSHLPYIFNERPDVAKQFEGFTYYPNTISYGGFTNVGTPALYGGYDYKPEKINARDEELLPSKQNEALMVMPLNFLEAGAKVNVGDPTYANYAWVADLSIFDKYPEINKFHAMGEFDASPQAQYKRMKVVLLRDLFQHSIFRVAPAFVQKTFYNDGRYNNPDTDEAFWGDEEITEEAELFASTGQTRSSRSKGHGIVPWLMSSLYTLKSYPDFTYIDQEDNLNFTMMSNDTTHEMSILKEPEYIPTMNVDNTEYDDAHDDRFTVDGKTMIVETGDQMAHYHINMAAAIELGKYFDYLREHDVYDNSRIIIVSDHGHCLGQFPELTTATGDMKGNNVQCEQALLLVKDFGAKEFNTSDDFMTVADVPYLATHDLVKDPKNPANGHAIDMDGKKGRQNILFTSFGTPLDTTKFEPGDWYSVEKDIFDLDNWRYEGHGEAPEHPEL